VLVVGPEDGQVRPVFGEIGELAAPGSIVQFRHMTRSPQVDHGKVAQELSHVPPGAGRHVHVESSLLRRSGEALRFLRNDRDVLGDLHGVLPVGAPPNRDSTALLQLAVDYILHDAVESRLWHRR
jgi:hypothetical protein